MRIATGDDSGVYYLLGRPLAEIYGERNPGVQTSVLETTGSGAGFFVSSHPIPAIVNLNAARRIRLLSIDQDVALHIRGDYPFFRPIVIPATAYAGQQGEVATVGVDNLLLCRSDLPDDSVYELTRSLIDSLQTLAGVHPAAAAIRPEQARSAVVPLHPGAARFYRERELFR